MSTLTTVKECDFLDQDPPLRGQNFVCLSFVSPEETLKKKEVFFLEKFLQSFSDSLTDFFGKLNEKYPDDSDTLRTIQERYSFIFNPSSLQDEYNFFVNNNSGSLEKDFYDSNNFQTSIRGIKVRGVFDTMKEADIRAQVLKKIDDKFHVYVAEVGCWCPWSPNPDDIQNQEYAETHLNTLMKHYKTNQDKRDVFYQERKKELSTANIKKKLEEEDPWQTARVRRAEEASTSTSNDAADNQVQVTDTSEQPQEENTEPANEPAPDLAP